MAVSYRVVAAPHSMIAAMIAGEAPFSPGRNAWTENLGPLIAPEAAKRELPAAVAAIVDRTCEKYLTFAQREAETSALLRSHSFLIIQQDEAGSLQPVSLYTGPMMERLLSEITREQEQDLRTLAAEKGVLLPAPEPEHGFDQAAPRPPSPSQRLGY